MPFRSLGSAAIWLLGVVASILTIISWAAPDSREWVNTHGLLVSIGWFLFAVGFALEARYNRSRPMTTAFADPPAPAPPSPYDPATGPPKADTWLFEDLRRDLPPELVQRVKQGQRHLTGPDAAKFEPTYRRLADFYSGWFENVERTFRDQELEEARRRLMLEVSAFIELYTELRAAQLGTDSVDDELRENLESRIDGMWRYYSRLTQRAEEIGVWRK